MEDSFGGSDFLTGFNRQMEKLAEEAKELHKNPIGFNHRVILLTDWILPQLKIQDKIKEKRRTLVEKLDHPTLGHDLLLDITSDEYMKRYQLDRAGFPGMLRIIHE